GSLREILEHRHAEHGIARRRTGANAVAELSPGPPRTRMTDEARESGGRLRAVGPKQLSERREAKPAAAPLSDEADRIEGAQEAIHAILGSVDLPRDLGGRLCPVLHDIGDAKFSYHADGLADPFTNHQVQEWRGVRCFLPSQSHGQGHIAPLLNGLSLMRIA